MQNEIDQEQEQVLGVETDAKPEDAEELAPGFSSLIASFEADKNQPGFNGTRSSDFTTENNCGSSESSEEKSAASGNPVLESTELSLTKIYDALVLGKTVRMIMAFKAYNSLRTSLSRKHRTVVESLDEIGGPNPLAEKYLSSSFDRTTERCEFSLQDKAQKSAVSYRIDSIL